MHRPVFLLFACLLLSSCGTMQDVSRAALLSNGMSKSEVSEIMGLPVRSEFSGDLEEWHYCSTSQGVMSTADTFVALFFDRGTLFESRYYTVTLSDTRGVYGDCSSFIKQGNYTEPDAVLEVRNR